MKIVFDDWRPDDDEFENPVIVAENVWPTTGGFRPALDYSSWGTPNLPKVPNSSYGTIDGGGEDLNFIGATSTIYEVKRATVTDRTSSLGLTTIRDWEFSTLGGSVIAVTQDQAPIKIDIATGAPSADFVAVGGSPPSGAYTIAAVRDFLVLGATLESSTEYLTRVRWSGFNNIDIWGSDASTQADFQDLPEDIGHIQRIVPGSVGYIIGIKGIYQMTYVGPPTIFRFDLISDDVGTRFPQSVVWDQEQCFFYSNSGFFRLDLRSGSVQNIGSGRVDRWFQDKAKSIGATRATGQPSAGIDRHRKLVFWAFADSDSTPTGSNYYTDVLCYSFEFNKWSYMTGLNISHVGPFEFNRDSLTSYRENSCIVIESPTGPTGTYGFFDGYGTDVGDNVLDATITTGDFGVDGNHVYLDGARPIVERGSSAITTLTVQCDYRFNRLHDAASGTTGGNTGAVAVNSRGRADFRVNGRYFRFTTAATGQFRRLKGIEFDAKPSGGR